MSDCLPLDLVMRNLGAAIVNRALDDYRTLSQEGVVRGGKAIRSPRRNILGYYDCDAKVNGLIEGLGEGFVLRLANTLGVRGQIGRIIRETMEDG